MEPTEEVATGGVQDVSAEDPALLAAAEVQLDDEQARIEAERKRLSEIRTQAEVAQKRHDAYLQAKDAASAAKAQWESAVETLQDLCLARDEPLPLLDGTEPEDWRDVRLDSLDPPIKPPVLLKLAGSGIETVGRLAEWTKDCDLLVIDGIGEAAKANIEEALDVFWKQRSSADEDAASGQGGNAEDGQ